MREVVLNARDFAAAQSGTAGIQEAIDALPERGGIVCLPPGRYALRRSVQLRSSVTLRGDGPATIITRPPEIELRIARATDGSRKSVELRSTRGLQIGDEIYIGDDENNGWWASHCIVREIRGTTLSLEILHGERKYRYLPERHARITNWFPAFWLREVRDVTIENLTIDGCVRKQKRENCDFVVAAIHTRKCENLRIVAVNVRNWLGDGIGIQGGRGAYVAGCTVENCCGHGYHPGTSLTQSIWADNFARGNTRDGLFFCLRVTHSTMRGNVLVGNAGHGIGGLTDPDMFNVVVGNVCAENGMHGIDADRAIGAVIQGNLCRNNSRSVPGEYAGIFLAGHRDCIVSGNICIDDQEKPTQALGLVNRSPAGVNIVTDNHCAP